jgi:dihydroneopterin aldolase
MFSIAINALRLPVVIGCGDQERAQPQPIRFDVEIALEAPPRCAETDQLDQTLDYDAVAEAIRRVASRAEYRLLERLVAVVRDELRQIVPDHATLTVGATKEKAPVANLDGGVSVVLTDRPAR